MTLPSDPEALKALADVCGVQRGPGGVVMHFGQRQAAADGALSVSPVMRVGLPASGAERLQDLLTALLQDTPPPGDAG